MDLLLLGTTVGIIVGVITIVKSGVSVINKIMLPETRLGLFRQFLDRKIKDAKKLSKKKNLHVDHILHWYQRFSHGLDIALGSDVQDADIKLDCDIIRSKVDVLKFYGGSQSQSDLQRMLNECYSLINVLRKDISMDALAPQFEPADLKTYR